jgi:hypothetical protein
MTNFILFLAVLCGGAWFFVGSGLSYWATDPCSAASSLCDNPQLLGWAAARGKGRLVGAGLTSQIHRVSAPLSDSTTSGANQLSPLQIRAGSP